MKITNLLLFNTCKFKKIDRSVRSILNIRNLMFLCFHFLILFAFVENASAQSSEQFNVPGTYIYTVPAGVTQITIEAWGGGGAGGGAINGKAAGGGGAGGAYVSSIIDVIPGESFLISVAAEKNSTATSTSANNKGNASWFKPIEGINNYFVFAEGGNGGSPANGNNGNGGNGATSISIGQIIHHGGNGSTGNGNKADQGGAGGGAGSAPGVGGNASLGVGGIGISPGGNGADGPQSSNTDGTSGFTYGGGGGGAHTPNSNHQRAGGSGSQGLVIITLAGCSNYWTGAFDNNWNNLGNWTCSIPNPGIDAVIPSNLTVYPLLSNGDYGACKNLIIQPGASVTVTNNTLQIGETITNAGTLYAGAGTISMNGITGQLIPADVFDNNTILNLTINNQMGVSLNGTLKITGVLLVQSGNLFTNDNLTLISTDARTALIDGSGMGEIVGNVSIQRYLPKAFGYKYLSSPFTNASIGQYADEVDLTSSFPNVYKYDESQPSTGWSSYIDPVLPLAPGNGYAFNFGTSISPITITTTGTVNNGTIGPITLTNNNQPFTKGFNLVGNPYPSPIDWTTDGWQRTNVDDALYFYDAGGDDQYVGTYSTYINGVSSNGIAGNIIPAQQAFFIHVTDGLYPINGSIEFTNEVRVNNLNPVFHKNSNNTPETIIRLSASFPEISSPPDFAVIYYSDFATEIFNPNLDALKIFNTDISVPSLYLIPEDNKEVSIKSTTPPTGEEQVIRIGINSKIKGRIRLKAEDIINIPIGYSVYLQDKYTGRILNMQSSPEYTFDISEGNFNDRFELIVSNKTLTQNAFGTGSFNAYAKDGNLIVTLNLREEQVSLQVTDLVGRNVLKYDIYGEGEHNLGHFPAKGIYIISISSDMGTISKKAYLN